MKNRNEGIDRELMPLIEDLESEGYRTVDYSCAGGWSRGHALNQAILVLNANDIHDASNIENVRRIIRLHTTTPFIIRRTSGERLTLHGKLSRIVVTPGSYVVRFGGTVG